jgi:short-subunit dehydrogenase
MTSRRRPFAAESLAGLSAVVTGGSRGLGLLIAGELATRGCTVTLAARDADELDRAAAGLRDARTGAGEVRTSVCDVRERDQVDALFTSVADTCG